MARRKLALTVALVAVAGLWTAGPARAGLVNQWKFDEGSGTVAVDSVGAQDGELQPTGNPPVWVTTALPPVPSGTTAALQFDQTSDQLVNALGYKGITGTNPRSMSAWIKTTEIDNEPIISWGQNSGGQKWVFRVQDDNGLNGAIRVEVNGGYIVGNSNVADGQWHHVAATWENDGSPNVNDVKLYVDGAAQISSAVQGRSMNTASNANVRIGRAVIDGRFFDGTMDEVRVYDHALTPREVRVLATGSTLPVPSLNYDAALDTDGNAVWEETVGRYATSPGALDFQLSGVTRDANPWTTRPGIQASYVFDGSATANLGTSNMEQQFEGNPTNDVASFEIWFRPADLTGQEILWEIGGSGDGSSLTLNDNTLQLVAKNGGNDGALTADLSGMANDFIQAVGVIDRDTDLLSLFVNGQEVAGSPAGLGSFGDWAGNDGGDDGALGSSHGNGVGGTGGGALGDLSGYGNFDGEIAIFRMYTEALSDEDALELYVKTAVPEPATLALVGLACAGLGGYVRRRKRT